MIQTYCMQSQVFNLSMFIIILIEICEYICQKWVKNRTSFGIKFLFPKIRNTVMLIDWYWACTWRQVYYCFALFIFFKDISDGIKTKYLTSFIKLKDLQQIHVRPRVRNRIVNVHYPLFSLPFQYYE